MSYLAVSKWGEYQHYKSRVPKHQTWIKYHVRLLDDTGIRSLPVPTRLLWDQLLLLAARYGNAIPNDSEALAVLTGIGAEDVANGVATLLKGRWIQETRTPRRSSNRLAGGKQNASPRTEQKREESTTAEQSVLQDEAAALQHENVFELEAWAHQVEARSLAAGPLDDLLALIGEHGDANTAATLAAAGFEELSATELFMLQRRLQEPEVRNRAKYAVGEVQRLNRERGVA